MATKKVNEWFRCDAHLMMIDTYGKQCSLYACGSPETVKKVSEFSITTASTSGLVAKVGEISKPTTIGDIVPGTFFMVATSTPEERNEINILW